MIISRNCVVTDTEFAPAIPFFIFFFLRLLLGETKTGGGVGPKEAPGKWIRDFGLPIRLAGGRAILATRQNSSGATYHWKRYLGLIGRW